MGKSVEERLEDFMTTVEALHPVVFVGHAIVYRKTEDGAIVGPEIVRAIIMDDAVTLQEIALLHYGMSATVKDITDMFDDFESMMEYRGD